METSQEEFEARIRAHNSRHLPYIFIGDYTAAQKMTKEYIRESQWALDDDEREIRERRAKLER